MSSLCEGIRATKVMGRASGFSPLATLNEPDAVTMHGLLAVHSNGWCLPAERKIVMIIIFYYIIIINNFLL